MMEKSKTFEVQREMIKSEVDKKRFILDWNEETNKWHFHAVEATNYSEEQLQIVLDKIKELNNKSSLKE